MAGPRIAVFWNDDVPRWVHDTDLWQHAMARPDDTWQVFFTPFGALPADPADFDAYILTGSHHSVNDPEQGHWLEPTKAFLRRVVASERRVFGSCFGHQLLCSTFGGTVGANPSGRFFVGAEAVTPREEAGPLGAYRVLQSHGECVHELPDGAVWNSTSPSARIEGFTLGSNVMAVQGHPELSIPEVRDLILAPRAEDGRVTPDDAEQARRSFDDGHDGPRMLEQVSRWLRRELD